MRFWKTGNGSFDFLAAVPVALLALIAAAPAHARELRDATGALLHLPDMPTRIVTLAPSVGELAADLLGSELSRIVGVSEFTDYPPKLSHVKSVGPYAQLNLESILALKPELVIATAVGNSKDQVTHLRELGLQVLVVNSNSFAEIGDAIRLIAQALGNPESGTKMAEQLNTGIDHFRARARARRVHEGSPRVLLQLADDPLIVAGGTSFLSQALEAVGATNAYGNIRENYPRPALEDAVSRDPEVILVLALGRDPARFRVMAQSWLSFPKLRAVRSKKVKVLSHADSLLRPSMRLLEGLSLLEHALYD